MALPGLIDTLWYSCKLEGFYYDVATKVLDTEMIPQHTIADLNLWHYIYCFVQAGEAFTVKGNKHTYTNTQTYIYIYIYTHTHLHQRIYTMTYTT